MLDVSSRTRIGKQLSVKHIWRRESGLVFCYVPICLRKYLTGEQIPNGAAFSCVGGRSRINSKS